MIRYKLIQLFKSLSQKERLAFLISAAVFCLSFFAVLTIAFLNATEKIPTNGGKWKEGIVGQPIFINPLSSNDPDQDISRIIFASLETLSSNIKKGENDNEWSIRLKEDIKWQDGEKITSDDIVFTIETILDPESRSPLRQSFEGISVKRISELETEFKLPAPYAFFKNTLKNLRIIPKHIFGNIPASNLYLSRHLLEPIGSSYYKFASFNKNKDGFIRRYRLVANKKHFDKRPYINEFIFNFFQNEDQLVNAYNRGLIDGFILNDFEKLNKIQVRHEIKELKNNRYYAIFINQDLVPQLKNVENRRLLSQTINREQLVKEVFKNFAVPLFGPTPENKIKKTDREFLPETININLIVPDLPIFIKTAELIKNDWIKIGVNLTLKSLSAAEIQEIIKDRSYEMILFGNTLSEPQDLYSFWHSTRRFHPGLNLSLYKNKEADNLMEKIRLEENREKRSYDFKRLVEIITDESPAIFLYSSSYLYIHSPKLNGFIETEATILSDRLNSANQWYIKTARKFK